MMRASISHTINGMQFIQWCLHCTAHPQAKPTEVRHNLKNFSPSKHVSASRLKSVGYAVRQERDTLAVNELYGISVDDTVQSVQLFCQSAWLGDLIARHNDADDLFHLDLFAPVCIVQA